MYGVIARKLQPTFLLPFKHNQVFGFGQEESDPMFCEEGNYDTYIGRLHCKLAHNHAGTLFYLTNIVCYFLSACLLYKT